MTSASKIELSNELDIPPPTVSYYLKKLTDMEIIEEIPAINGRIYPFPNSDYYIERKPIGSEKFYRGKSTENVISFFKLLFTHKSSFDNKVLINSFLELHKDHKAAFGSSIDKKNKENKKIKYRKIDDQIENVTNIIYECFRPHFCA
jgi:hypothetical protein